jgi:hypothetical protein
MRKRRAALMLVTMTVLLCAKLASRRISNEPAVRELLASRRGTATPMLSATSAARHRAEATREAKISAIHASAQALQSSEQKGKKETSEERIAEYGFDKSWWTEEQWTSFILNGPCVSVLMAALVYFSCPYAADDPDHQRPQWVPTLIVGFIIDFAMFYYNWI